MGLKEAMLQIKQDTSFWMREVCHSVARQKGNKGSNIGGFTLETCKVQAEDTKLVPPQPKWHKSKGPPKGGKEWPHNWAKVSPKGVQFCRYHFLKKKCPGNCGCSRNCPVLKNRWVCNAAE